MLTMNLNISNAIKISDRDNSGPYTIFIMFLERYIDIRGRITNFKVAFFVFAYFFMHATGTLCYFYAIRHFSPFKK